MQKALRFIINEISAGRVKNREDLQKVKLSACRKYGLDNFPSNAQILEQATAKELSDIRPILQKKPTRTISGVAVVAVMCPPHNCPHGKCFYCPQSKKAPPSYTGEEPAALRARMFDFHPYKQVYNRLLQLDSIGHPVDKVELIIMGGTFPAQSICYQEWFVTRCIQAMNDFGWKKTTKDLQTIILADDQVPHNFSELQEVQRLNESSPVRCVGMTFETRPDYCKMEDIDRMLSLGVTRVELGVQTIYDHIYHRIQRGHRVEDVKTSNQILRDSGLKVAMHLMPGLFSDFDRDMRIFKRIFADEAFKPDMLKIYPCLVVEGSGLHDLWQKNQYKPYTTREAVDLIVEIKKILPPWVRTMRIQRDIPSQLIEAGVKKSNLGELVYKQLQNQGIDCQCIRCREVGHKASLEDLPLDNIEMVRREYDACGGREIFLSLEDVKKDVLVGFLRLRMPSLSAHRSEVDEHTALIRELHVYGSMVQIGYRKDELWQHKGYGEQLLLKAEEIAGEDYDKQKVIVTSGIGAREYYSKFGYHREGPYMSKKIKIK